MIEIFIGIFTGVLASDAHNNADRFEELAPQTQEILMECGVDAASFEGLMDLDSQAFDQDINGGWRTVSYQDGCREAAAELILAYLRYASPQPSTSARRIISWHGGQMLAAVDRYEEAIPMFEGARQAGENEFAVAWNLYVEGTLAFLGNDLDRLQSARDTLAVQPVSEETKAWRRRYMAENPELTFAPGFVDDPQNLAVLDHFLACFGSPYWDAYSGNCGN